MKSASVVGITFAMFLICVIAVSSLSSAEALTIITQHSDAYGQTVVDIEGHPVFLIDCYHYDSGSAPFVPQSTIRIWRYNPGISRWLPVAYITDSLPSHIPLFYAGYKTSIQVVDPGTIDVRREGNSKTLRVVWNEALEVPEEHWGPPSPGGITFQAMTIPPGMLIFRGHGDSFTGTTTSTAPGGTATQTVTGTLYYGNATFVNPTWDFGGPVGVNEGTNRTIVRTDGTVITTIY